MRITLFTVFLFTTVLVACVDPEDITLHSTNDILVVDGTITDQAEPQIIHLSRSQGDRLTGRFNTVPVTKATMEVVVDSSLVIAAHETVDGSYQLPGDFKGQIGHTYHLRFTLSDGTSYVSTQQIMPPVSPIMKVSVKFNLNSLSPAIKGFYTAGHDLFIDTQDPASEHNYYRWEWTLWERQYWCHSCTKGVYSVYKVLPFTYKDMAYFVTGKELYEDCFTPNPGKERFDAPEVSNSYWIFDYQCRTSCWHIFYDYDINIFDDKFTNGSLISQKKVASIPFYDYQPGLVDIRQFSLTADAYRYYKLFQDQTEKTSGLADAPPTALGGNVHQVNNPQITVVGYFSASSVSLVHYWLDRKDTQGVAYGATDPTGPHLYDGDDLFYALNGRRPYPEPPPPYTGSRESPPVLLWPNTDRPPKAPCLLNDNQTPFKPEGWRD